MYNRHFLKSFLIFLTIVFLFSLCAKNPVDTGYSVAGERILFMRGGKGINEICTMKPDGSDIQVIAHYDYSGEYINQGYGISRWSPDKSKIVVEGGPGSTLEYWPLWLMDMEGNLQKRLTWNGYMPIWTTDSENVIYSRRRGYFSEIYDIYKININSLKEDTILFAETGEPGTNSGYIYRLLDIFPNDNSKLLLNEYYTYRDTAGEPTEDDNELLIYDVLHNTKQYLTDNDLEEGWAKISPDGNFIAYSISKNSYNSLYLMTSNGDSIRQLTSSKRDAYLFFTWSPDGREIAYSISDQSKGYNPYMDIFIIDVQSGIVDTLTNTAQDSIYNNVMDWK